MTTGCHSLLRSPQLTLASVCLSTAHEGPPPVPQCPDSVRKVSQAPVPHYQSLFEILLHWVSSNCLLSFPSPIYDPSFILTDCHFDQPAISGVWAHRLAVIPKRCYMCTIFLLDPEDQPPDNISSTPYGPPYWVGA